MDRGLCMWKVDYAERLVKPGCTGVVIPMEDDMEYLEYCPKCGRELANVGVHTDLELDPHAQMKEKLKENARGSGNNKAILNAADIAGADVMLKLPRKSGKHLFLQVHTAYVNGDITNKDLEDVLKKAKKGES